MFEWVIFGALLFAFLFLVVLIFSRISSLPTPKPDAGRCYGCEDECDETCP